MTKDPSHDGSHDGLDPQPEILPADPRWQAPRARPPVVYDVAPSQSGEPARAHRTTPPPDRLLGRLLRIGSRLGLLLFAALLLLWLFEPLGPEPLVRATEALRNAGWLGRGIVVLAVAALVPLLVPVGPLAILPGYLWGTAEGTALALAGATLGGLVNLHLSRRYLGPTVHAWMARSEIVSSLHATIDARGFRIVLGLRLSPVMPYGLLSYLSGITSISVPRFALACMLGGIPWTTVYGMAGAMLAASAREVTLEGVDDTPETLALRWFGLALTLGLAVWIGRMARKDLLQARERGRGP